MEPVFQIKFAKTRPDAILPTRAHSSDAGFDLYAVGYCSGGFKAITIVDTGIQVAIPSGYVGLVCPRSGLAADAGITVVNSPGIIDSGYRGNIKVILSSLCLGKFEIKPGDKIAQLVVVPCLTSAKNVPYIEDETDRGADGLGSTGR